VCLDEAEMCGFHAAQRFRGVSATAWAATSSKWRQGHAEFSSNLPDKDLAYFLGSTEHFDDYVKPWNGRRILPASDRDL